MHTTFRLCAAAAAVALCVAQASACGDDCGYGYTRYNGYFAPPAHAYVPPPPYAYYGPPVSYYAPTAYGYYAPVAVYRGPRRGYGYNGHARYYTAPVVYAGSWRRSWAYRRYAGPRLYAPPYRYARPYRPYARGPVVRTWRRW